VENDFLDLETVADILGIDITLLSEYVESRRLIANRIAGQLRFQKPEMLRILKKAERSERNRFPEVPP
jgi:predicted site-specific integrase-resolvase